MRINLTFLLFLVLRINTKAQLPQWDWAKHITTSAESNYNARIRTCVDQFGNFFLLALNNSTNSSSTVIAVPGYFVAKYSNKGIFQWSKHIKGHPNDIGTDDEGNLYIAGYYPDEPISSMKGVLVIKLDPYGTTIWNKNYNSKYSGVNALAVTKAGNVYITGSFSQMISLDNQQLVDSHSFFVAKLNKNGIAQWARSGSTLPLISNDTKHVSGNNICLDKNENIYTIYHSDFNCYYCYGQNSLAKFDRNGNLILNNIYGYGQDYANGLAVDTNLNIFISLMYNVWTSGGNLALRKYSPAMQQVWVTEIGSWESGDLYMNSRPALDPQGNIYMAGWMGWLEGYYHHYDSVKVGMEWFVNKGFTDIFISKIDNSTGSFIKSFHTGGKLNENVKDLCVDKFGNLFIAGVFNEYIDHTMPNDTLRFDGQYLAGNSGLPQIFTAKLKLSEDEFTDNVSLKELSVTDWLNLYPNPSSGKFSFVTDEQIKDLNICIYDITGACIYSKNFNNSSSHQIDLSSNQKGIYFLQAKCDGRTYRGKIVVN